MKREKELQKAILIHVRDGKKPATLNKYTHEQEGFHAALLVEEGYIDGKAVRDENGQYIGASLLNLTSKGYDLLEELESISSPQASSENQMPLDLFISHSSKDKTIAEALAKLLRLALNLESNLMRCTSVEGYRLAGGVKTDDVLRTEIQNAKAFLALITGNSLDSFYVLIELGARWGTGKPLIPLLAGYSETSHLGPIGGINALDCRLETQVRQLLEDLSRTLDKPLQSAGSYSTELQAFVSLASALFGAVKNETPPAPTPDYKKDILRICATGRDKVTEATLIKQFKYSEIRAKHYLKELKAAGLLTYCTPDDMGYGDYYYLSDKGKAFVVEHSLDENE